ncbi:MAG: hypothetical protein JW718_07695 [Desulfovibrionaceae bacterium]|nr:hypothetical protein [Desulfovibrionaceae bacterium]
MIEQIEKRHEVGIESWIEDGKRWFRVKPLRTRPNVPLTPERVQHLLLCRDMVRHLMPKNIRRDEENTIAQSTVLLPDMEQRSEALAPFTRARVKGAIDYTPRQEAIEALFLAIRDRRREWAQQEPVGGGGTAAMVMCTTGVSGLWGQLQGLGCPGGLARAVLKMFGEVALGRIAQLSSLLPGVMTRTGELP